MSRYRFIDQHRGSYPVRRLCQVLAVPPSRYYAWQQRAQPGLRPPEPAWEVALDQTFVAHKKRYGTRRLRVALRQQGHRVGRQALRTAMRRRGLRALQPKAYPRTTDGFHARAALCPESFARPAAGRTSQPRLGERHHLLAAGQRRLGLSLCVPGCG